MQKKYIVTYEGIELYTCDNEIDLYKWLDREADYQTEYEIEIKYTFYKNY